MKSTSFMCALLVGGCSAPDAVVSELENIEAVNKIQAVQESAVKEVAVWEPINCPVMIKPKSEDSNLDNQNYLFLYIVRNPDFNLEQEDTCQGDLRNLWHDILRFEVDIESHLPNVVVSFNARTILDYFPKTENELKNFIDQASKSQSLSHQLDKIDRSTLNGRGDYNKKIIGLIREQEKIYFETVQTPALEVIFSKYGKVRFLSGREMPANRYRPNKAYCYHPHKLCRGDYRYARKITEKPESQIGRENEFDLEYLWAGISSYAFVLVSHDESID